MPAGIPSNGHGSVRIRGRKWEGRIYTTPTIGTKVREILDPLGKADELTKEQAQRKLAEFIVPRHAAPMAYFSKSKQFSAAAVDAPLNLADGFVEPADKSRNNRRNMRRAVWAEMLAAGDLLMKGFEVYRPYNPLSKFDLLVLDGCNPVRIEVKLIDESGKRPFCELRRNLGNFDVLACVFRDGRIIYRKRTEIVALAGKNKRFFLGSQKDAETDAKNADQ